MKRPFYYRLVLCCHGYFVLLLLFYYDWKSTFSIPHPDQSPFPRHILPCARAQEPEDILDTTTIRPVVVDLPDFGRIQGKRQSGIDFFGGLPYAAPPVGPRRWAPPEPPAPWAPAKLDATQFGPDCWQLSDPLMNPLADVSQMSEDCLYLNVYTPAGHAQARYLTSARLLLPVMVWLHGGAFQQGGARRPEYDGRRLAERGTIVVTINYRLGALGFLVSSPDGLFGNFGLMDQRAALRWVKDNIIHFGGDPDNVLLFGESAGAVMTGLHLMMDGAGKLFHKAIIQSNPLGLQFRSIVVADFIGEALKRAIDCRDLACLRTERVEEIMRAQSSLMGVPRSVGDFFTWGPTLTDEIKLTLGAHRSSSNDDGDSSSGVSGSPSSSRSSSSFSSSPLRRDHILFRDLDFWKWQSNRDTSWSAVNVTQPLKHLNRIPDDIPVIVGANKHEGEMFVHGAFPITMSKAVYWMFVGALFRDSASRVLKHYRGYVDQIEKEAQELARKQIEEEECRQFYVDHQEVLEKEYRLLLELNSSEVLLTDLGRKSSTTSSSVDALLETWSRGGSVIDSSKMAETANASLQQPWYRRLLLMGRNLTQIQEEELRRLERRRNRAKERALKEAAKVVVDYRPVMSRIIDDYLFRCPSWHFAHSLSRNRLYKGKKNNVYVYQFSHSTHVPGFKECWGKSCHTSELPYVFQAMDIIRTNYSTLSEIAQAEAPTPPEYPYTEMLAAYRNLVDASQQEDETQPDEASPQSTSSMLDAITNSSFLPHAQGFQRRLQKFFGDYFKVDADEEISNDMADRWVAFAKTGDPNYDSSRSTWRPWRHVFDDDHISDKSRPFQAEDFEQIFRAEFDEIDDANVTEIEGYVWSSDPGEQALRRRALKALGMLVVEEDVFQTMLLRKPKQAENDDHPLNFLFGTSSRGSKSIKNEDSLRRKASRQLQQIAQDMGLLGRGLAGEPMKRGNVRWEDDFFPEILELKWPPEGRLVERDCTCDMWDRIRCKWICRSWQVDSSTIL